MEYFGWLCLIMACRFLAGDGPGRNVREWKLQGAEHVTAKDWSLPYMRSLRGSEKVPLYSLYLQKFFGLRIIPCFGNLAMFMALAHVKSCGALGLDSPTPFDPPIAGSFPTQPSLQHHQKTLAVRQIPTGGKGTAVVSLVHTKVRRTSYNYAFPLSLTPSSPFK